MSIERIVRVNVVCDHARVGLAYRDCPDKSRIVTATAVQARNMLRDQGWSRPSAIIGGEWVVLDLCPDCTKRAVIVAPVNTGGRPRSGANR